MKNYTNEGPTRIAYAIGAAIVLTIGVAIGMTLAVVLAVHMIEAKPVVTDTQHNNSLQPYGLTAEDDTTAAQVIQPADYSKQTTKHYYFLQGNTDTIQGSSPTLQANNLSNQ